MSGSSYRVELEVYSGPLDLLLRLVTREEVSIYDIPVARITDQFLAHLRAMPELDVETAGDFLVLAATLLSLKARMLLPAARPEDDESGQAEEDPRAELVRRLMVYRRYREVASWLSQRLSECSRTFDRGAPPEEAPKVVEVEAGYLSSQLTTLILAYRALLAAQAAVPPEHRVTGHSFSVQEKMADLLTRLERAGAIDFEGLFSGRRTRGEIVATFLAVLELVRLGRLRARQTDSLGRLELVWSGAPVGTEGGEMS